MNSALGYAYTKIKVINLGGTGLGTHHFEVSRVQFNLMDKPKKLSRVFVGTYNVIMVPLVGNDSRAGKNVSVDKFLLDPVVKGKTRNSSRKQKTHPRPLNNLENQITSFKGDILRVK